MLKSHCSQVVVVVDGLLLKGTGVVILLNDVEEEALQKGGIQTSQKLGKSPRRWQKIQTNHVYLEEEFIG